MVEFKNTLITEGVYKEQFVCDLSKCKGACCVEGDLGAPLELDELDKLEEVYDRVAPFMTEEGRKEIEEQGLYVKDWEDDFSTPTIAGKECAYAIYGDEGILGCAIEKAYKEGLIDWQKPISCHLYPIRVTQLSGGDALNYDEWSICSDACVLGKELKVPVYKFVKGALIRKYGEEWFQQLDEFIAEQVD